ncbi:MAG: metallophosphoesterase, partial [Bordetella sp.]|uniref:metallophosphoesterase n=1 Tax=Bordetella sp. TaxID=28081 RepID=UPI003F7BC257
FFFVRCVILFVLGLAFVARRVIAAAPSGGAPATGCWLWLVLSCVLIPMGMLSRRASHPRPWGSAMAWIGLLALGFFSSLFVFTALRDAVLLIAWIASLLGARVPLAALRAASAALVPALALLGSIVGFINARGLARVVTVSVPVAGLPEGLENFTIVQISDVHVGPTIKAGYVRAIVDAVNAECPDVIAITGDVVDGSVEMLSAHTQPLADLRAPHGVYLVTGNHEYYSGATAWVQEFRRLGLRVLMNEHAVADIAGNKVVVAGVTDYTAESHDSTQRSDPARALAGTAADAAVRILLAHQPRSALAAAPLGYTLQLSGHTHGGQFFPWGFFVRLQQPFTAGLYLHQGMWVYVSRGTGYWGPPKRLWAPSEITRIQLVRSPLQG